VATAEDCDGQLSNIYLSLALFFKMNPSVKSDCSGLVLNTYYCVSEDHDGFIGEYPSDDATPPTTTSISTPAPIQVTFLAHVSLA
jgi:hypothetical protein